MIFEEIHFEAIFSVIEMRNRIKTRFCSIFKKFVITFVQSFVNFILIISSTQIIIKLG
jgi:hypothetical protein